MRHRNWQRGLLAVHVCTPVLLQQLSRHGVNSGLDSLLVMNYRWLLCTRLGVLAKMRLRSQAVSTCQEGPAKGASRSGKRKLPPTKAEWKKVKSSISKHRRGARAEKTSSKRQKRSASREDSCVKSPQSQSHHSSSRNLGGVGCGDVGDTGATAVHVSPKGEGRKSVAEAQHEETSCDSKVRVDPGGPKTQSHCIADDTGAAKIPGSSLPVAVSTPEGPLKADDMESSDSEVEVVGEHAKSAASLTSSAWLQMQDARGTHLVPAFAMSTHSLKLKPKQQGVTPSFTEPGAPPVRIEVCACRVVTHPLLCASRDFGGAGLPLRNMEAWHAGSLKHTRKALNEAIRDVERRTADEPAVRSGATFETRSHCSGSVSSADLQLLGGTNWLPVRALLLTPARGAAAATPPALSAYARTDNGAACAERRHQRGAGRAQAQAACLPPAAGRVLLDILLHEDGRGHGHRGGDAGGGRLRLRPHPRRQRAGRPQRGRRRPPPGSPRRCAPAMAGTPPR